MFVLIKFGVIKFYGDKRLQKTTRAAVNLDTNLPWKPDDRGNSLWLEAICVQI